MTEQTRLDIAPTEVQITDPQHICDVYFDFGTRHMAVKAREIAEKHKIVGMALMADLMEAHSLKQESRTKLLNVGLAARAGLDFTRGSLVLQTRPDGVWLLMAPNEAE